MVALGLCHPATLVGLQGAAMKPGTQAFYKHHEALAVKESLAYLSAFVSPAFFRGRKRILKAVLERTFLAGRAAGVEGMAGALGINVKGGKR